MHKSKFDGQWPENWKNSYIYDMEEMFGLIRNPGYFHLYQQRRFHALDLVKKVIAPPAKILDIAAAQGKFSL